VIVSGIAVLNMSESLAEMLHVSRSTVGLIIGAVLVTLSVPPGLTLWKALADVSEEVTQERLLSKLHVKRDSFTGSAAALIEHSLLAIAMFIIAVWMTPLLWELVSVGELATPASALIVVATMALTARIALKIHSALEETVERTFLGEAVAHAETASQLTLPVERPVVREEPVAAPVRKRPPAPPVSTGPSSGSEWQRLSSERTTRRRG
jgi:hypothetical protein